MPGKTIGVSLNNGFAGTYAQQPDSIINTAQLAVGSAAVNFGAALMMGAGGTVTAVNNTCTVGKVAGVAGAQIQTATTYASQDAGSSYVAGDACSVVERGAVSVLCKRGTPERFGGVFLRITANGSFPGTFVGGFETTADAGNTIDISSIAQWAGAKDANDVATLVFLTRNAA